MVMHCKKNPIICDLAFKVVTYMQKRFKWCKGVKAGEKCAKK